MRLPQPLNEDALRAMMQDDRYWNSNHPEYEAYNTLVQNGFRRLYGDGPAPVDEFGRMVPDQARPVGEPCASGCDHSPAIEDVIAFLQGFAQHERDPLVRRYEDWVRNGRCHR